MHTKKHAHILFVLIGMISSWSFLAAKSSLTAGKEYFLYNVHYGRVLGQKADRTPGLSILGINPNSDSYIFVAETTGTNEYFYLKQKSTGKYLTASTANSFSVTFSSAGVTDNYLWSITTGTEGSISSKKSPSKLLGCDTGKENDTYVSVFYDKLQNAPTQWQIVDADNGLEQGRKQLYLSVLERSIKKGMRMSQQQNYLENLRTKVSNQTLIAQATYNNASAKTLAEIIESLESLQSALLECFATDTQTLLTGDNFDVNDVFTLALNRLKFADNGEFSVLVRNGKGKGAIIEIAPDKISIDDEIVAENLTVLTDPADYQFAFTENTIKIYRNNTFLGTKKTFSVPTYTSNGTNPEWSLLGATTLDSYIPEVVSASNAVSQGDPVTDKYGNNVRHAVFIQKQNLTLSTPVDFHIMNETDALLNSTIDLANDKAWVILDNTLPSDAIQNYLSSFTINGSKAINNYNVRVGVYLNGTLIMPYSSVVKPFTGFSNENYGGDISELKLGANELGNTSNAFQSFTLKRGYMATVASGANGGGYSRVYVADHQDINIPILPQALNRRISSVHIKKWNYVSKKGWCSTTSNAAIATECKKMRATWFYTWSADRGSTSDTEYIPIKGHLYWPSTSQINGQINSTHVLSFNEPEHSEQHTSDKCSCGGVISAWTACTKTPDFQPSGMRIGSPAPTDASWLTEYIGHCNDMAYRCDFVVMHCYWGTNEAPNAASWYSQLKSIYDKTKRPIWITEWNNGASWTTESWPSGYGDKLEKNKNTIREILNVLDTCRFVERYSIYNWDSYYRAMINTDDGWVTPAGQVYRDNKSTFAYNADVQFVPVWWVPSLKTVSLKAKINSLDGKIVFTVSNDNGDMTDKLIIQRKKSDGTFENFYTENNRSTFDTNTNTYSFDLGGINPENDEFRLYITTTSGGETYSNTIGLGYLVNPNIITASKTTVEGWTCLKSAANGYTKATNDTYLEVWNSSPIGMYFDYYQDVTELAEGVYELSAACFNSTNGVAGSSVNGHVGLYAQADGIEYFAPVTNDSELNTQVRQTIAYIAVKHRKLRIGIKNIGEMSARWAGADEFKLKYIGTIEGVLTEGYDKFKENMQNISDERYLKLFVWNEEKTTADAGKVIINPDCLRNDTYGWAANNIDFSSGGAFDGISSNNYWNKWSSTDYTSEMYQDLSFLPEGSYSLNAMLRCSIGGKMKLYMIDNHSPDSTSAMLTGTGITPPPNSAYPDGWNKITTEKIEIRRGENLRIGFITTMKNQWWSADHFTLTYEPLKSLGVKKYRNDNIQIVTKGESVEITTKESVNIVIYTLSGKLIYMQKVDAGINRIALSKGIYLINDQKIIVR